MSLNFGQTNKVHGETGQKYENKKKRGSGKCMQKCMQMWPKKCQLLQNGIR